jgi:hypothetical protein
MTLLYQINQLEQIHFHIEHKSTGSPRYFANRLKLSVRSLYRILEELKDLDVHIHYNKTRGSYEYMGEHNIPWLLKIKELK